MKKPIVKNAANEAQLKESAKKEIFDRERELRELRDLLASPLFRRFLWRVMEKCKTFGSIWEQSARIHYLAGQQDIGHFLMAEVGIANEDALFLMMKENKQREEPNV